LIKTITKSSLFLITFSILLHAQQEILIDTSSAKTEFIYEMEKSSWGAVGRSAILPGWGQFYNEDYWHIPVVWGFLGWFGYQWILNNNDYTENQKLFIQSGMDIYKRNRDFYRDQRDQFTIYFVITYMMNLVDAFVGAHLFDFSVEEDYISKQTRLKIQYNF
jgi:hypothetical protein